MKLLSMVRTALRPVDKNRPYRDDDPKTVELHERQHEQANRLQRIYGDDWWSELRRDSWKYRPYKGPE